MKEEKLLGIINSLPEEAKVYVLWLVTGLIVLGIVNLILKQIQTPEMKKAWIAAKSLGGSLANFSKEFAKDLELPVKHPCGVFIAKILYTLTNYLLALYLLALSVLVAVLSVEAVSVSPWQRLVGVAFSAAVLIFALFCFAEAERGRVSLPLLYAKCRGKSKP